MKEKNNKIKMTLLILLVLVTANVFAQEKDRYFITFYGRNDVTPGHAFVAFGREDASAGMSLSDGAWGLYPNSSLDGFKSALPGDSEVPGKIEDEAKKAMRENNLHGLMVEVSKSDYDKALDVVEKWKKHGKYELIKKDCVSFVMDVANQISGFSVPDRDGLELLPRFYILKIIEENQ